MIHKSISIFGTRGVPANYGGFETFAHHLSLYLVERGWDITVYCQSDDKNAEDIWHDVKRVHIAPYLKGALGTAEFDLRALLHARTREKGAWLTLGYNTGGFNFLPRLCRKKQMINMDGMEWKRAQWSPFYRFCLWVNYWLAGWAADRLIADHPEIEKILKQNFNPAKIKMIAYGAESVTQANPELLHTYGLQSQSYDLVICRAVPENNMLEIIRAYSRKKRSHKLVILSSLIQGNAHHDQLKAAASDDVLFVGAIFDPQTVQALRFYARIYIHGHTVGGTNPSLVEALGVGNAVIAHDNVFNRWVAGEAASYFRNQDDLARIFDAPDETLEKRRAAARKRHAEAFQWSHILEQYEAALLQMLEAS